MSPGRISDARLRRTIGAMVKVDEYERFKEIASAQGIPPSTLAVRLVRAEIQKHEQGRA